MYLPDEEFTRYMATTRKAKEERCRVERPEREGDTFKIKRGGAVVYESTDLAAIEEWFAT